MLYIARLKTKDVNGDRLLRKITGCNNLQEATNKCKELYPKHEILSIQISKRKLNAALARQ